MKKIFVIFIVSLLLLGGIIVFAGEDDEDIHVHGNLPGEIITYIDESW
jgi:hypothetical protein